MGTMREKLINLREEKGLTQADVASCLGISRQAFRWKRLKIFSIGKKFQKPWRMEGGNILR